MDQGSGVREKRAENREQRLSMMGGGLRRWELGGDGWARGDGVCGRIVEFAGANGRLEVLRWASLFDEHDAPQREFRTIEKTATSR